MKKLIALGVSAATLLALPTTADARDWGRGGNWDRQNYSYRDRDGDRDGDRYRDRYRRYSGYGYRNYGYAYPRSRTVISVGYGGYYGGYGGYGYPAYGYGYPSYGYGYPSYGYGSGYGYPGY